MPRLNTQEAIRCSLALVAWMLVWNECLGCQQVLPAKPAISNGESSVETSLPPMEVSDIALGHFHTCALDRASRVVCWGAGDFGQTSSLERQSRLPRKTFDMVATRLALGEGHSCAILSNDQLSCWGIPTAQGRPNSSSPGPVLLDVPGKPIAIAAGALHTCMIALAGNESKVYCAGNPVGSTLGSSFVNEGEEHQVFQEVAGLGDVKDVAAGSQSSCALKSDGTVRCWGFNGYGSLGNTTFDDGPHSLVCLERGSTNGSCKQPLENVITIRSGGYHACAVTDTGATYCWGRNDRGQVDGRNRHHWPMPVRLSRVGNVVDVALGATHSCALKNDTTVWCWGGNDRGQLGRGTIGEYGEPAKVKALVNIVKILAGSDHTCALDVNHALYCWGANHHWQIGQFPQENCSTPIMMATPW